MRYVLLFIAIQLVSWGLFVPGFLICAILAWTNAWQMTRSPVNGMTIWVWRWGRKWWQPFWLWSNDEDGVIKSDYVTSNLPWSLERSVFVWTAWRNSVNNLRFVPGVSGKGRPLWQFKVFGKTYLAGWHSDGWPTLTRYA